MKRTYNTEPLLLRAGTTDDRRFLYFRYTRLGERAAIDLVNLSGGGFVDIVNNEGDKVINRIFERR